MTLISSSTRRHKFTQEINSKLKRLRVLDNWHGPLALMQDLMVIGLAIELTIYSHWFYPLSLLLIGSRQRALATIMHEASHSTLARSAWLNNALGWFSGALVLQSLSCYKETHVRQHHRYLGHDRRDPEHRFHASDGVYTPMNARKFIWRHCVAPWLGSKIVPYGLYLINERMLQRHTLRAILSFMLYIGVIAAIITHFGAWLYMLLFWIAPFLLVSLPLGYMIELSEHYPADKRMDSDLHMSRNRNSNWIEAVFLSIHNENFHLVHHLRPDIPFWQLKQAHKVLCEDEQYASENQETGGILFSANYSRGILARLVDYHKELAGG